MRARLLVGAPAREHARAPARQRASVQAVLKYDHSANALTPREPLRAHLRPVLHGLHRDGYFRFNASWGFAEALRSNGSLPLLLRLLDRVPPDPGLGGNAPLPSA